MSGETKTSRHQKIDMSRQTSSNSATSQEDECGWDGSGVRKVAVDQTRGSVCDTEAATIQICVKTDYNEAFYQVSMQTTVFDLKVRVLQNAHGHESFGHILQDMWMKGGSKVLSDNQTLLECGLDADATLSLEVRVRGGGGVVGKTKSNTTDRRKKQVTAHIMTLRRSLTNQRATSLFNVNNVENRHLFHMLDKICDLSNAENSMDLYDCFRRFKVLELFGKSKHDNFGDNIHIIFKLVDILTESKNLDMSILKSSILCEVLKHCALQSFNADAQNTHSGHSKFDFQKLEKYRLLLFCETKNVHQQRITDFQPFVRDRIFHRVSIAIKFLQCLSDLIADPNLQGLMSKISGTFIFEADSIGWMMGNGLSPLMKMTANAGKKPNLFATEVLYILVVECYINIVVLSLKIEQQSATRLLTDTIAIFQSKMEHGDPIKDWGFMYSCLDLMLNIALRFPDLQGAVLDSFQKCYQINGKRSFFQRRQSHDYEDYKRIVEGKILEVVAQIACRQDSALQDSALQEFPYDVFISHTWDTDDDGRDNHARAKRLNTGLQSVGLNTWFDEDQMQGNIMNRMSQGISGSAVVLICVTRRYMEKVSQEAGNNCKLEFEFATQRRTDAFMVPVVMENSMTDTSKWNGSLGLVLGRHLYHRLTIDTNNEFDKSVSEIAAAVRKKQPKIQSTTLISDVKGTALKQMQGMSTSSVANILTEWSSLSDIAKESVLPIPSWFEARWLRFVESTVVAFLECRDDARLIFRMFGENADEASLLDVGRCEFAENVWSMLPQEIQSNVKSQFISLKGLFLDMESCKLTFLRHLGSVFRGELLDMPLPDYLSEPESLVNNCEEQHDIITLPVTTIPSGEIGVVESGGTEVESGEIEGEVMFVPESFVSYNFIPPVYETKKNLQSSESESACILIETIVETLRQNVEKGYLPNDSPSKTNVVVMGLTGAGKSTMVNCLAGCEMEEIGKEEAKRLKIASTALRVKSQADGGAQNCVTAIGLSASKSETRVLQHISIPGQDFVIWDAPGFEDSSGPEVSIANAVNLSRLLGASEDKGLVIVVLLDSNALLCGRGSLVKKSVETLGTLFGSDKSVLSEHAQSMLFIVNKVQSGEEMSHDTIRELVVEWAKEQQLHIDIRKQVLLFDPLKKYMNTNDSKDVIWSILSVKPILASGALFKTSLSDRDHEFLRTIADSVSDNVSLYMDTGEYEKVKREIDFLFVLDIINHPVVARAKLEAQEAIIDSCKDWFTVVMENKSDYCPEARARLRYYLQSLEGARCLDSVLDSAQVEVTVNSLYERATSSVQFEESNFQKRENESLLSELNELLQGKNQSFRAVITRICDRNPESILSLKNSNNLYDLLAFFQDPTAHTPTADNQHLRKMEQFFVKIDRLMELRACEKCFIYGDQHDLETIKRSCSDKVLDIAMQVVRQAILHGQIQG
jgi:hypothetical protein